MSDDHSGVLSDFKKNVNMTASQIEHWLGTDESKEVGQKQGGEGKSTGHQSGKHIIRILHKKQADYMDADYQHMQKVNSYVARHSAQKPHGDVEHTHWRYSLMNWGHDPLKK